MKARKVSTGALAVVGGAYHEHCLRPHWAEVFGSGGRAACAIARLGHEVELHCYADNQVREVMATRAAIDGFVLHASGIQKSITFDYDHALSNPRILDARQVHPAIEIKASMVLRFGMLEGQAVVDAETAVYDPQDAFSPEGFAANGSKARRLAVVLNRNEAQLMLDLKGVSAQVLAENVRKVSGAAAVVIKQGPAGALVLDDMGFTEVPAFRSSKVWKIGSGDNFAAHFAAAWMAQGRRASDAAEAASLATAYYCETQGFADQESLVTYAPAAIRPSSRFLGGGTSRVYLAGPFFSLAQLWVVGQARMDLMAAGLEVFSPYHDIGCGSADDVVEADLEALRSCDLVFAIGDGMDPGTVFEVGYARSIGKPVVFYCENESEEARKMMEGSGCSLETDYVTAVYRTLWAASEL